jgi:hypothetical protein
MATENNTIIKISSYALLDHLGRLYEPDHDGDGYKHIDQPGAYLTVSREGDLTCTVELTAPALQQFIADMEYQCEFAYEGSSDSDAVAYRARCRRALDKLKHARAAHRAPAS